MLYQPHLEFANFICKFGDKENLLDYLEQIVLPAFLDSSLVRTYGDDKYFLSETRLVKLQSKPFPVVAIVGQLIKDTMLESTQVYDYGEKGLKANNAAIPYSPSSMFVLTLHNHKLVYLEESKSAPSVSTFKSTLIKFLVTKRNEFIRSLYNQGMVGANGKRLSLRALREIHPLPNLEVVPLASKYSLSAFVESFSKLTSVKVQLHEPNDESYLAPLLTLMRNQRKSMKAVKTTLEQQNSSGLDKSATVEQLAPFSTDGNASVMLNGKDMLGNKQRGDQDEFKLRIPVSNLPEEIEEKARMMNQSFLEHVDGLLQTAPDDSAINAILEVYNKLISGGPW